MKNLGKKIVILGASASGKSTFARALAEKLKLPLIHIDAIMWQSGWNYIGDEQTVSSIDELSQRDAWIIEGYITRGARQSLFDRAETIIFLDYAPHIAAWRYIKRWWKHHKYPRPELEGSPDKFNFKYLKLIWKKGEATSLNRYLTGEQRGRLIRLTSPRLAKVFLNSLDRLQ